MSGRIARCSSVWGTPEQAIEWATRARHLRQRAAAIKAGAPTALKSAAHAEALARGLESRVRMAADAFIADAARKGGAA